MSVRVIPETFASHLARSDHTLVGAWVCSGSPLVAEIMAGAGFEWIFIDAEHSPNGLESVLAQLHAVGGTPAIPVVRPAVNDAVLIKQYLDLGVQNLIIPMVDTPDDARRAVAATRYPPEGIRGVGAALARSSRWNRSPDYLATASSTISLIVQIESAEGVRNAEAIAATTGVDAVFIGPSDLAASMGYLGQQDHPEVVAAIDATVAAVRSAGTFVGINAFQPEAATGYIERSGVNFIAVGADVSLLARASEQLAEYFRPHDAAASATIASY